MFFVEQDLADRAGGRRRFIDSIVAIAGGDDRRGRQDGRADARGPAVAGDQLPRRLRRAWARSPTRSWASIGKVARHRRQGARRARRLDRRHGQAPRQARHCEGPRLVEDARTVHRGRPPEPLAVLPGPGRRRKTHGRECPDARERVPVIDQRGCDGRVGTPEVRAAYGSAMALVPSIDAIRVRVAADPSPRRPQDLDSSTRSSSNWQGICRRWCHSSTHLPPRPARRRPPRPAGRRRRFRSTT